MVLLPKSIFSFLVPQKSNEEIGLPWSSRVPKNPTGYGSKAWYLVNPKIDGK